MRAKVAAWISSLVVLCCGDFVWLGLVARDFYGAQLAGLLRTEANWVPALFFYPLYGFGLVVFCVTPALAARSWRNGLGSGALFGLVAYATYDLSNLATLEGWPVAVTFADIAWGVFVSAMAAWAGYAAAVAATSNASVDRGDA